MPVAVKRHIIEDDEVLTNNLTTEELRSDGIESVDVVGNHYKLPVYYIFVLRKELPVILFYLSRGIKYTLDFLGVSNVISFVSKLPSELEDDMIYFQLSGKCYIRVIRELFYKYSYIQSIVGGFLTVCTNRTTIDQLNEPKVWIKRLVTPNNYEKGKDILKFFNRLCDSHNLSRNLSNCGKLSLCFNY